MTHLSMRFIPLVFLAVLTISPASLGAGAEPQGMNRPPAVGQTAPDFTLRDLGGTPVTLSAEIQRGPVVLVLLRGWPGRTGTVRFAEISRAHGGRTAVDTVLTVLRGLG